MQSYMQSIRTSALTIIDRGRRWDGGLFKLIGDNSLLYNAMANTNGTFGRKLITGGVKSTILSGGTLIAIVFTVLLVLALLALCLVSIYSRSKASSQKHLFGKLQSRASRVGKQLHIPSHWQRLLLGILSAILLILALVPLVLAFATNSRLHVSVSDTQTDRDGTVANQVRLVFTHVDNFLTNLVPDARVDVMPVVNRTLEMTAEMKTKSQAAYQQEFREVIGANNLTDASSDMLDRISLYYDSGKRIKTAYENVNLALNDLKHPRLEDYEDACNRSLGLNGAAICREHKDLVNQTSQQLEFVRANWTQPRSSDGKSMQNETMEMANFLSKLVGALDITGNTPDKQREMKEQKVNISNEFNRNISSVFDRELNSTEFILNGVNEKLNELEDKIQSVKGSLRNMSVRVQEGYSRASFKYESMRFGATTGLNILLLITLVFLATASAIILLVPNAAKARSRSLIGCVYASYLVYAIALVVICIIFCLTSYLRTEACRYMYEEKTADKFLVPEVNAVISELKARAASDPNKTDAIPLKGVNKLIGGILQGCQANQPIVVALDAVEYIDTEVSNSAEQSLQFKKKGRDILRREMSSANLEVLRDKSMEEKMKNLRFIFKSYTNRDFASVGEHLFDQRTTLNAANRLLKSLKDLNDRIDLLLSGTTEESSAKKLSELNKQKIEVSIAAIKTLLSVIDSVGPEMQILEARKAIVSVIDRVIVSNRVMDTYLSNQTAWTETAAEYYTKHVIEGSTSESKAIADNTTIGFLSSIAKCRDVYNLYQTSVGIPCQSLLYPMSILWFCLAWFLWFAVLLSMLVHLSLACFIDRPEQQQQQQQQPLDDHFPLSTRAVPASKSNHTSATTAEDISTQNPLLSKA